MERRNVFVGVMLLAAMGISMAQSQTPGKLALDSAKPIVYIEFDHAGPREPVEQDEPARGLWLRLVNNSVVAIEVETMDTATQGKLTLLPDVITPIERRIPRSGVGREKMPSGYAPGMGVARTIAPGKDIVFSVPANHVSPNWYMQVPFHFSLAPVKEGEQPICYAAFTWENLPKSDRSVSSKRPTGARGMPAGTLLHESSHIDPPKQQGYDGEE
jgi:hypothetical protein